MRFASPAEANSRHMNEIHEIIIIGIIVSLAIVCCCVLLLLLWLLLSLSLVVVLGERKECRNTGRTEGRTEVTGKRKKRIKIFEEDDRTNGRQNERTQGGKEERNQEKKTGKQNN